MAVTDYETCNPTILKLEAAIPLYLVIVVVKILRNRSKHRFNPSQAVLTASPRCNTYGKSQVQHMTDEQFRLSDLHAIRSFLLVFENIERIAMELA